MSNTIKNIKEKVNNALTFNRKEAANRQIADNVNYYRLENEEVIRQRIDELSNEWDVERSVQLNASLIVLGSIILGAAFSKKWLFVSGAVSGLLALHAAKGWSLSINTGENLRTRNEIAKEQAGLQNILKNDTYKQYEG